MCLFSNIILLQCVCTYTINRRDLSTLGAAVDDLSISSSIRHSENSKQLETVKLDILLAVREDGKALTDALNQISHNGASANFAAEKRYEDLLAKLISLAKDYAIQANSFDKAEKILSSLLFSAIEDRRSNISMPESRTFGWIFGEDEENNSDDKNLGSDSEVEEDSDTGYANEIDNVENRRSFEDQENAMAERIHCAKASELFQTWLRVGKGLFYISGKAGSGKSTLMKFIVDHRKTKELLDEWARSYKRQLTTASFFFWNAGAALQKSHEGLLRSLLFQILNQCRDLIPPAMPERWKADKFTLSHLEARPWTLKELSDAINRVTENASIVNGSFCFFIDGLDEYQGAHRSLVKDIHCLCTSSFVKICVSSRPWNIFEHAFGQAGQIWKLSLQDCTKSDIHRFIQSQLAEDDTFKELVQSHIQAYKLIDKIEHRADGVFLWVVLVVRELHAELDELGSFEELEEKLDSLPPDLDAFFKHILDGIDKPYKRYMAKLLLLCLEHHNLPLVFVHFLYEDTTKPGWVFSGSVTSVSPEVRGAWEKEARRKVNKWCRDLLQVRNMGWMMDEEGPATGFSHRSVKDYLQQEQTLQDLYGLAGSDFEPYLTKARLYLAFIKCLDDRTAMNPRGAGYYRRRQYRPFFTKLAEYTLNQAKYEQTAKSEAGWQQIVKEIDQACTDIWVRNGKGPFHWTSSCLSTEEDTIAASYSTFLMYTIQHNLLFYVREKIAEMSDEDCRSQGSYLFFSSLCNSHLKSWSTPFDGIWTLPQQLLLRGVDVNAEIELIRPSSDETEPSKSITRTVWETFLKQEYDNLSISDYLRILHLCLEAGANVHCALPEGFTSLGSCLVVGYVNCIGALGEEDTMVLKKILSSFEISVEWNEVTNSPDVHRPWVGKVRETLQ